MFATIRENQLKLWKNSELCGIFTCNSHLSSSGRQWPQKPNCPATQTVWQPGGGGRMSLQLPQKPHPQRNISVLTSLAPLPFPDTGNWHLLFFSPVQADSKESALDFFSALVAGFKFTDFRWDLYYFLSSAYFGFIFLLLFSSLAVFHKFWYAVFTSIQFKIFSNFYFDFFDLCVILNGII